MTPDMIIAGICLAILAVGQLIKLHEADKEYKEALEEYLEYTNKNH